MNNTLYYIVNHVFYPPKLPQGDDLDIIKEHDLCALVHQYACEYQQALSSDQKPRWDPITRMLANLRDSHQSDHLSKETVKRSMAAMGPGDVIAFLIRAQNAGIILRKLRDRVIFESFEVSPPAADVMGAKGKLVCSFPGPAIAIFSENADDPSFRDELASFLMHMDADVLDSAATTTKAGSTVVEERDTAHPRYITLLLTGILRGMGQVAEITRIQKRIGDDVLWDNAETPWRRSPLWLVIRVALQTSLYQESNGHDDYKAFMVFFMARILELAVEQGFSSDLIFCMRAKMSRRLYKLGSVVPDFVLKMVHEAGEVAEKMLQKRWLVVQENQSKSAHWAPENLDIPGDIRLSLDNSKPYISQVLQGKFPPSSPYTFEPKHSPRYHSLCAFYDSDLSSTLMAEPHVALADFELAVQNDLDDWVDRNLHVESGCSVVASSITQYSDVALELYASDPESQSLMLLTIFELWVALDKMAVAQCPLLGEYSPEVPLQILEPLLLRRSKSFARLASIKKYLRGRYHHIYPKRSIFADEMNANTFAVRYFDTSDKLRSLQSRIEQDATLRRQKKLQELQSGNASHTTLMDEFRSVDHNNSVNRWGTYHYYWGCKKCMLERQADNMNIELDEWPLPRDPFQAKTVVFELDCPPVFSVWRTTTYQILNDICLPNHKDSNPANPPVDLETYQGFGNYVVRDRVLRITLASTTKSFMNSHYKSVRIPSTESSVCVNNGLQFRLFDKHGNAWASKSFTECTVVPYCTLQLPDGPYKFLQYAVDGTSHTSNQVMANQSECPKDLNLHEYIAFASLRSGNRIQWLNIVRELSARSLSFHREEVHILLIQAAWQIGHLSQDAVWEWHIDLSNVEFSLVLLKELEDLTFNIQANWLESATLRTIIVLTSRLLASINDPHVENRAYSLLRRARGVAFKWLHQLAERLQESKDEEQLREFQLRVCETAATCRGTYDVDPNHTPLLLSSSEDIAVLTECAIRLRDNTPPILEDVSLELKRLLYRDRRLSHSLESLFGQRIREKCEGLDHAVTAIWTGYLPSSNWKQWECWNDRWFTTETTAGAGQDTQRVQLNLLEGQLLIDGKPLGRLPQNITEHATYTRIFGQKILDVIPSGVRGMDFATRDEVCGYKVHFTLRENNTQLVIRTTLSSETLELIPHERLTGDLPTLLVQNYVHWLNMSNGEIELRPLEDLWTSTTQNWRIQFLDKSHPKMYKEPSTFLVDVRSPTFQMISSCLKPLEYAEYLTITYSQNDHFLSVDLARFRLSFFLNSERLIESQNLSDMVIDSNQSTGTMFGLTSQLILRTKNPVAAQFPRSRCVLIPHGKKVHFKQQSNHVSVAIDTRHQSRVKCCIYNIDTDLGLLVGNSNLTSKLYKVYLHALSSHCLPDPLTGRTGTEEALHEFGSASCRSFQKLNAAEASLLRQISTLTPRRTFYPPHLEVMQKVNWSDLSPITQHYGFYTITQSIMEYAERLQVFYEQSEPGDNDFDAAHSSKYDHLLERAGRRAAIFYTEEFRGPLPPGNGDVVYASRHTFTDKDVEDETRVVSTSNLVYHWPSRMNTSHQLFDILKQWRHVFRHDDGLFLSYSRDWLRRDLAKSWIGLYDLCRGSSRDKNRFQLMFSLSAMSYSSPENRDFIPTLLSFATTPHFRVLHPPLWTSYDLLKGFELQKEELLETIRSHSTEFEDSPEARLPAQHGENDTDLAQRRRLCFQARVNSRAAELVDFLTKQWPCEDLRSPSDRQSWPFDIPAVMSQANASFRNWLQNSRFRDHIGDVQIALDKVRGSDLLQTSSAPAYKWKLFPSGHPLTHSHISFDRLFQRSVPLIDQPPVIQDIAPIFTESGSPIDTKALRILLSELHGRESNVLHRLYGDNLEQSRKSLDNQTIPRPLDVQISHTVDMLTDYRNQCGEHLRHISTSICQSLSPSNLAEMTMCTAGLWPRITTRSLLSKLAFGSNVVLTSQWKKVLISFAQGILWLQQSQRLLRWASLQNSDEFFKELENTKRQNQDAMENPDWLLIQVDSNFLARPVQISVAQQMMVPSSHQNTVLQLNMGEGKSSVIVPLIAASLADGRKLTRVIVLKSLSSQMFQLLVGRLSGLPNRRIFYMPFSRKGKLDARQAQLIEGLYMDCMREGGVLVVQPEHVLSFKLMGIDQLLCSTSSTDREVANKLLESQRWLEKNSRDILDESDEILHIRYQLIYTVGLQQPVEDCPNRWTTTQQVLSLVKKHASTLQKQFPLGVKVTQETNDGSFTPPCILQAEAGQDLVSLIAEDALNGGLFNYSFELFPDRVCQAAMRMITKMNVPEEDARLIKEHCEGSGSWKGLLLLRGLLGLGILVHTLKEKRWRVDYGLDLSRSLLAVPYRAKDVPALRAEFGHPDVAIVLTCLSYYYGGLTDGQLDLCFELLFKLDNPSVEYEKWIHELVPKELRKLSGVNTKDPEQRKRLIPLFRRNHAVNDFFLSQVVFPKEAREFPKKLTTSGWDIASVKNHFTTGFSGTNDNRYLLPISIKQHDPPEHLGTNAKVLSYILQPENKYRRVDIQNLNDKHPLTTSFLDSIMEETPKMRILLDVGAQMLELQNAELAKYWLSQESEAPAVIFFGDNDEMVVMTRDHSVEPLISSPFSQQLEKCLVYLDDAHTRGTDLKLPRDSRAAVTLGPKVTKDRLVQGCMRMRMLGRGQSVTFFATLDVDRSIQKTTEVAGTGSSNNVQVLDVLRWVMLETCADIRHHVPHWVQQGIDYESRRQSWSEFSSSGGSSVERLKSSWLQPGARKLETLYKLSSIVEGGTLETQTTHYPATGDFVGPEIHDRCQMLGVSSFSDMQMEEEQEREVNHEMERERQIERPSKAEAAIHVVHDHVRKLITTGIIPPDSSQFVLPFFPLFETATTSRHMCMRSPNLLTTKDFSTTIQTSFPNIGDYLRPVNWIISCLSQGGMIYVVLSPYEVNDLLPEIRKSGTVHLHQYSPRITQAMKSFEDLKFCCIPPLSRPWASPTPALVSQLNLWAGQLYLADYGMYLRLCEFLGIYTKVEREDDTPIQSDGFIKPSHRRDAVSLCPFTESPLPFLKEFIGLRRKGMGYLSTHMWKILNARLLTEDDFKY